MHNQKHDCIDKMVITKEGFDQKRVAGVLMEEICYSDDFQPYRVLWITFPLVGSVSSDYIQAIKLQGWLFYVLFFYFYIYIYFYFAPQ